MAEPKKTDERRWIKTTENRVGVILSMAGFIAAALLIVALAEGLWGWFWIALVAVIVIFGGALLSLKAGASRPETLPLVYHPDSPDVVLDVDRETGERTPHQE